MRRATDISGGGNSDRAVNKRALIQPTLSLSCSHTLAAVAGGAQAPESTTSANDHRNASAWQDGASRHPTPADPCPLDSQPEG